MLLIALLILSDGMTNSKLLDTRLYYSGAEAREFLNQLNSSDYLTYQMISALDLIFLGAYTLIICLFLRIWFSEKAMLFGLIPGVFDFLETSGILYALTTTPQQQYFDYLGAVTFLKWSALLIVLFTVAHIFLRQYRKSV